MKFSFDVFSKKPFNFLDKLIVALLITEFISFINPEWSKLNTRHLTQSQANKSRLTYFRFILILSPHMLLGRLLIYRNVFQVRFHIKFWTRCFIYSITEQVSPAVLFSTDMCSGGSEFEFRPWQRLIITEDFPNFPAFFHENFKAVTGSDLLPFSSVLIIHRKYEYLNVQSDIKWSSPKVPLIICARPRVM
jgi:hypothetical protein